MSAPLTVVTGATGLVGSHVTELLARQGHRVRALVRSGSDTAFLDRLGVDRVCGDLGDAASLARAVAGADAVLHCAARVGDWGPWRLYREAIVDATARLIAACAAAGVGRLVHVSSINVYGHPRPAPGRWLDEDTPLGQRLWLWDYYCRAKIEAERLVRGGAVPWTIVRPSWVYGPRDRNSLPRVIKALRAGRAALVGSGDNLLNIVHAADVADGVVRAAAHPGAVGRAYNLASDGAISQRQFLDALADALGLPRVRRRFPFRLAFALGFLAEVIGRAIRLGRPPHLTRYAVALIGRPTHYSTARARGELGWRPTVHPLDGLREALAWYQAQQAVSSPPAEPCRTSPTA